MEIVLKRSQTSLLQIQDAVSRYFDIKRVTPGRHEWIEGELKQEPGLGKHDLDEDARISIAVPYDEKSRRTLMTRILSPFSGTLYHLTLQNLDLPTTLTVIEELQYLGDVGFGGVTAGGIGGRSSSAVERIFVWPEGREAQLSKATEIHRSLAEIHEQYAEKASHRERKEPPPHQLCGGIPSEELCARCKFNVLKGGTGYCNRYDRAIGV